MMRIAALALVMLILYTTLRRPAYKCRDMSLKTTGVKLIDRGDRLGTNLLFYISTVLVAMQHNFKVQFIKPRSEYRYATSIFVQSLFAFIDEYNETAVEGSVTETSNILEKYINCTRAIQSDFVTAFRGFVHVHGFAVPFDAHKTIAVHLRLDDRKTRFVDTTTRTVLSNQFRDVVETGSNQPQIQGQSAMKESEILRVIERALREHEGYDVVIITNGKHTLPYRTISIDEDYDLFLLSSAKVLIGSMSCFSFVSVLFGNHSRVYYPLWDHAPLWGLTTRYDKSNITFF